MYAKLSKSIYQYARSNTYYDVIEVLSELQIQLSLFEINLLDQGSEEFSIVTTIIKPISLVMNLRSPALYNQLMDNSISIWITNGIVIIYLIIPLLILVFLIKSKYAIPNFSYSWISYFKYMHLYIISYIIHGWLIYQTKKAISTTNILISANAILLIIPLIIIIANITVTIFICKTCISQVYLPGFIGYKYPYNTWMNLVFKLMFPIIQVFESSSIKTILFLAFAAIWGSIRQYYLIVANIYYNYNTMKMMSCIQGITFGIIISNLIAYIIQVRLLGNLYNIYGLLMFFILSFCGKYIMQIQDRKVNGLFYKIKNLNDIDYASQYFLIEQYTSNCHKKGFENQNVSHDELISNGLLFSHKMICNECFDQESLQHIRNHLLVTRILEGLTIHKHSFLLTCLAINFYLNERINLYRCCFLFEKLKRMDLSIQEKIILELYEIKIEEALCTVNNDSQIDYGKFAACENFYEMFLSTVKNATETYLTLWVEINSPIPNLLNVIKYGIQIRMDHKKFKKKFTSYEILFIEEFAKPLLLAGLYYDILKNKHDKSFFMLQKYTKLMRHNTNINKMNQITKDTFYSKNNVNIRISGSDDSLGNIISCSGNITELTNLTAGKLIGRNITYILPNFFAAYHNDFIREYKETGISNIINKTNVQFCRHEDGYLIPVESNVLIYPMLDYGLIFLGIIRIAKTSYEYMLINQDGEIEGMTLGISKDLNFKADYNKINFCSLLCLYHRNHHYNDKKPINFDTTATSKNCNINSIVINQPENISINHFHDKKIGSSSNNKNESQLFSRISQYSQGLFSDFVENYSRNYYTQKRKKIFFKKIVSSKNQKVLDDNKINCAHIEYTAILEKNYYRRGLHLYKLILKKCNTIKNQTNFKNDNFNVNTQSKKIVDFEDNQGIKWDKDKEYNTLSINQPFTKKPNFTRKLSNDSNNKKSIFFIERKTDNDSIKKFQTIMEKTPLLSTNVVTPKLNNDNNNLSDLFLNSQQKTLNRKESISLYSNFQEENIVEKEEKSFNSLNDGINLDDNEINDKNERYSKNSAYLTKNAKIKSKFQKKQDHASRQIFKFRSIFFDMNTFFMVILFLLSIISIFATYSMSTTSISKIDQDLLISFNCNQRLANLVEINRRLRNVWLIKANLMSDKRHDWRSIPSYSKYCINKAVDASKFVVGNNSLISSQIQSLDIEFQNDFYSHLIKLYNVNKRGQRLLKNYTETNSFIAGYQIYQVVNQIRKLLIQDITINDTNLLFILRNNLNDIYIEYERSSHILINELNLSISSIEQTSLIILIIIFSISGMAMLLLIHGISALFYKKKKLLMEIVNINIQYCQFNIYRMKQFLKGLQENYNDSEFISLYDENKVFHDKIESKKNEAQNNKKSISKYKKNANTFGIKLDLAKSFFILLVISIIYIVTFYVKTIIIGSYMESINTVIQRILFSSVKLAQQSFAMAIVYEFIGENGTTIVENNPIELVINQTMPAIANLEGFLANFHDQQGNLDPFLQFIMIGNVCTIVPPEFTKECVTLGGGPGQNGISNLNSFIYKALSTALTTFESSNRTIQDANNTFWLWYLRDLEGLFYRATMPAYSYLYNQLLEELDNEIKAYQTFVLAWTLTSFLGLLLIAIIIWLPINRKLMNEIISMRSIMKIIPKSIIEIDKSYNKRL